SSDLQTLMSASVLIPDGLKGKSGVLSVPIKCASSTCTHVLSVYDGTNEISATTIASDTSKYARTTINFGSFPTSGNLRMRLRSVASDEPSISVGEGILGDAFAVNLSQVNQSTHYGSLTIAGASGCAFAFTGTSYADIGADSDCSDPVASGNIGTSGGKVPGGTTTGPVAPGKYLIQASFHRLSSGGVSGCYGRITDGTTSTEDAYLGGNDQYVTLTGVIEYTTPQSARNWRVQLYRSGGTSCSVYLDGTDRDFQLQVWRFPTAAEIAYRQEQADYDWTAYTPSFTGFGTVSGVSAWHKRVGSNLLLKWVFTSGTTTATEARMSLPTGLTSADSSKIATLEKC